MVVAIIGVISALAVPAYEGYVSNARARDAQMTLRSIVSSQEAYRLANGGYATVAANCTGASPSQCNCSTPAVTAATSCDPSATTSANVSACLLRGVALNSTHYYFCAYADNSVVPPIHGAVAMDLKTSSKFTVDQNGKQTGF